MSNWLDDAVDSGNYKLANPGDTVTLKSVMSTVSRSFLMRNYLGLSGCVSRVIVKPKQASYLVVLSEINKGIWVFPSEVYVSISQSLINQRNNYLG